MSDPELHEISSIAPKLAPLWVISKRGLFLYQNDLRNASTKITVCSVIQELVFLPHLEQAVEIIANRIRSRVSSPSALPPVDFE